MSFTISSWHGDKNYDPKSAVQPFIEDVERHFLEGLSYCLKYSHDPRDVAVLHARVRSRVAEQVVRGLFASRLRHHPSWTEREAEWHENALRECLNEIKKDTNADPRMATWVLRSQASEFLVNAGGVIVATEPPQGSFWVVAYGQDGDGDDYCIVTDVSFPEGYDYPPELRKA